MFNHFISFARMPHTFFLFLKSYCTVDETCALTLSKLQSAIYSRTNFTSGRDTHSDLQPPAQGQGIGLQVRVRLCQCIQYSKVYLGPMSNYSRSHNIRQLFAERSRNGRVTGSNVDFTRYSYILHELQVTDGRFQLMAVLGFQNNQE